jgi:Transcription factor WhiB
VTAPQFGGTQACVGADSEVFFPSQVHHAKASIERARQICRTCRFLHPCLEYAVWAQGVPGRFVDGVWGGTTAGQRAHIRRMARRRAA